MLSGRLGLRPGEIQHLHEGWIDWDRGVIRIPQRDPCACNHCYETARHRQRVGDGRQVLDILAESTWTPPGGERTVPFGWSQRLTAVVATLCDVEGYLGLSAEAMARLINRSAHQAEGLAYDSIDIQRLRATAAAFFADAGFSAHRIAGLLGEDVDTAGAFARREGGDAREQLFEQFTESTVADPGAAYSLLAEPEPFDHEPFDPRTYDADWRWARAEQRASYPDSLRNPRPVTSSVDSSFNVADLGERSYLDRDSGPVDEDGAAVTLKQWVSRREAQRYDTIEESTSRDQSGGSGSQSRGSGQSTSQSGQPDTAPDEGGSTSSESQAGERATVDSGGLFDPRELISGNPIITTETTVACSGLADGQPVPCRVVLGASELVLARADDTMADEYTTIPVDSIADLSTDQIPSEFEETFESTVAIAYDAEDSRQLAILELRGNKQIGFANELFKLNLQGCEIIVTHPAKRGGRVLDTDPVPGELTVDDRSVTITASQGDDELTIRLSDIIHIGTGKQTYESLRMRGLSIRHLHASKEAAETAIKLRNDRQQKLFERFVKGSYRKRKEKIEELTITEAFKEVLVALYSASDEMDISMIIDKNPSELQEVFDSLQDVGLVRMSDEGTVLTGLGRVVVNEKIQDVNT